MVGTSLNLAKYIHNIDKMEYDKFTDSVYIESKKEFFDKTYPLKIVISPVKETLEKKDSLIRGFYKGVYLTVIGEGIKTYFCENSNDFLEKIKDIESSSHMRSSSSEISDENEIHRKWFSDISSKISSTENIFVKNIDLDFGKMEISLKTKFGYQDFTINHFVSRPLSEDKETDMINISGRGAELLTMAMWVCITHDFESYEEFKTFIDNFDEEKENSPF